jgi:NADP-dependent 3-hydroxy acid dehydrogenase YdfG
MTIPSQSTHLVTGASSGIGRAIALSLAAPGRTLHLMGRDPARLDEIAGRVRDRGATPITHSLDLSDPAEDKAIRALGEAMPTLDVLVHSAGAVGLGPLKSAPIEELDWMFRLNLRAPCLLTQALLPALERARGQVVFINSGAGLRARGGWGQYAATKFGLKAIADSLRDEVSAAGIRVMSAFPGRTASPMQERVRELEGQPYRAQDYMQPEDLAEMVLRALEVDRRAGVHEINIR